MGASDLMYEVNGQPLECRIGLRLYLLNVVLVGLSFSVGCSGLLVGIECRFCSLHVLLKLESAELSREF